MKLLSLTTWALLTVGMPVSGSLWAVTVPALTPFQIEDQFGSVFTETDYQGEVLVIVGGDRHARKLSPAWAQAIRDAIEDPAHASELQIVRVADLRSVPSSMRESVRRRLADRQEESILLDWEGHFAGLYGFQSRLANIVVLDRDRRVAHQAQGREPDEQMLAEIARQLRQLFMQQPNSGE